MSARAMVMDLPLSRDSMEARISRSRSKSSASLVRYLPRSVGGTCFQGPSNVFRATSTAMSTSFSVASQTETMGFSVVGLIDSNFLPSLPSTHSLLMNLWSCQ